MKQAPLIAVVLLLAAAAFFALGRCGRVSSKPVALGTRVVHPSPTRPAAVAPPTAPNADITLGDVEAIARIVASYTAEFDFWGKIVDQFDVPVEGARVQYSLAQKYFGDDTMVEGGLSDAHGLFTKRGMTGASAYVIVTKDGYYGTPESSRTFGYGVPVGDSPPSKEHPAIFVLRKRGVADALIASSGHVVVPVDGSSVVVSIRGEKPVLEKAGTPGDAEIAFEVKVDESSRTARWQFDWRCRVSIAGGGLAARTDEFQFEAPLDGYMDAFVVDMRKDDARWINTVEKEFFVKFADGRFGRVRMQIVPGGDHFIYLESYLNPIPGRRNLEFDRDKILSGSPP